MKFIFFLFQSSKISKIKGFFFFFFFFVVLKNFVLLGELVIWIFMFLINGL